MNNDEQKSPDFNLQLVLHTGDLDEIDEAIDKLEEIRKKYGATVSLSVDKRKCWEG